MKSRKNEFLNQKRDEVFFLKSIGAGIIFIVSSLIFVCCNISSENPADSDNRDSTNIQSVSSDSVPSSSTQLGTDQSFTAELTEAKKNGFINYSWAGIGNSGTMILNIKNETEREWLIHVEVGTKLEPEVGDVQSMVVTKEIHVTAHPHNNEKIEVEVSCLDISKPPPGTENVLWTVAVSSQLSEFIQCINRMINEEKGSPSSDIGDVTEQLRYMVIQFSLWKARGASKEEWIEYLVKYLEIPEEHANKLAEDIDQNFGEVLKSCPLID